MSRLFSIALAIVFLIVAVVVLASATDAVGARALLGVFTGFMIFMCATAMLIYALRN